MSHRFLLAALCAALSLPVHAGEWEGEVTLASQYVSRGFDQTWGGPALQAGATYTWDNGLYAGTWASNVDERFYEGATHEIDYYVGYSRSVGDLTFDGMLAYYSYPGARMSASDETYDYGELVASVGWKQLTVKYAHTVTGDYNGYNSNTLGIGDGERSRGSGYFSVDYDVPLTEATALKLHGGYQTVRNFDDYSWADGSVMLEHSFNDAWQVSGGYARGWDKADMYDAYTTGVADADGEVSVSSPLNGTWVVSVTRSF